MARTPEAAVKHKIRKYLKTIPSCWSFMPIGGPFSAHGVPDIVGTIDGDMFAIEVKAPGKEKNTTANQERVIGEINAAGAMAFVASNVEHVRMRFKARGYNVP
jgi:Holliday junction resolvase